MMKGVYLDYNSTTPLWPEAVEGAKKAFREWGNPSSIHQTAAGAKALLWESRKNISRLLSCHPLELIFTSGASESNNQAVKGLCHSVSGSKDEVILSAVEHPSILSLTDFLKEREFKVYLIPVKRDGTLDIKCFEKLLSDRTFLVSVMLANNETGVIYPIRELVKKTREKGALFHSDMVQGFGKIPIDLKDFDVDAACFSGHKFHSLKGCGLLYCKRGAPLKSLIDGGPQERSRRAGTENLPGIAALGAVAGALLNRAEEMEKEAERIKHLRDEMEELLLEKIPQLVIVAKGSPRLNNTCLLYVPEMQGETLLINLDLKGFSLSAGSACNSGKLGASSVLTAMGFSEEEARSCLRVSIGHETTIEQLKAFAEALEQTIKKLHSLKQSKKA